MDQGAFEQTPPKVFSYQSYQEYLLAFFNYKKSLKKDFSLGVFARLAKMGSSDLMRAIVRGRRRLVERRVLDVACACQLTEEETEYFKKLVEVSHRS